MERKVCFILEVGNLEWGGGEDGVGWAGTPISRPNLPGDNQGARAFID